MYFCLIFIDIWWNSGCTRVRKDGIICEGNFILKISKHLELISFLFGDENPIIHNLLDVKKLPVFVTYVTTEFYIFGKQNLVFLDFCTYKNSHTLKKDWSKRSKGIIVCNFCYHIFIVINFSLHHSLQKENFEILKNSLHSELWWRRNFV